MMYTGVRQISREIRVGGKETTVINVDSIASYNFVKK